MHDMMTEIKLLEYLKQEQREVDDLASLSLPLEAI